MRTLSKLIVYRSRLERNLKKIHAMAAGQKMIAMVKANAYGSGLIGTSQMINELDPNHQLVSALGTACLQEAIAIRKLIPHCYKEVYVFSELNLEQGQAYKELNILPVIGSLHDLKKFLQSPDLKHVPLCLKFNTGMNRLGIEPHEVDEVMKLLSSRKNIHHIMTHFACSYFKNHASTTKQIEIFDQILSSFRSSGFSLERISRSNSGAIEQSLSLKDTHVRPGLMMYGPSSLLKGESPWEGEIISDLQTHVLKASLMRKGDELGYGLTKLSQDGIVLTLPLGYGDGVLTQWAGVELNIENYKARVIGRVNMDLCFVQLEGEMSSPAKFLDKKILLWNEQEEIVNRIAQHCQTHSYQVLCAISSRVPREYHLQ
jgi:alanine racemase